MAENFAGPVTVTEPGGQRRSVLEATSLSLGQAVSARRRVGGFLGSIAIGARGLVLRPGARVAPGADIVVDPAHVPVVPDVILDVGDRGAAGGITVRDDDDRAVFNLNGANGLATFGSDQGGVGGGLLFRSGANAPVIFISGKDGRITFFDARLRTTMIIDGIRGDIELQGADCAEDFEVAELAESGSVVCAGDDGRVRPCRTAYCRRVVGVVSGTGDLRPGIRLGRRSDLIASAPLALAGRVHCLADARHGPIGVGDLLTTSVTSGHAMRASDPARAFGAVVGKSLSVLPGGRGMVQILVSLQ
jgi:hypothetical protein